GVLVLFRLARKESPDGVHSDREQCPPQPSVHTLPLRLHQHLCRRTITLSSGGGRVSYEPQETYMPPPSSAAPGYSSWPRWDGPTLSQRIRGHGLRRPHRGPISTRCVPRRHERQGSGQPSPRGHDALLLSAAPILLRRRSAHQNPLAVRRRQLR